MKRQEQERLIRARQFDDIFIGQGWDEAPAAPFLLPLDGREFSVRPVIQKKGFIVCVCESDEAAQLGRFDRRRLLRQLRKRHYEHLLIIVGADAGGEQTQHWSVAIRPHNCPSRAVSVTWREKQDIQILREKLQGLIFPLAEEEKLTIVKVVDKVREAFESNSERITNHFYRQFQAELKKFADFVKGMPNLSRAQYAALMLNRLMFVYFIQKKGFLNGEADYLRDRLAATRAQYGKDQFHDKFYRAFLRRLFHEGLNAPMEARDAETNKLLGKVPYLNGGLFDVHKLEIDNAKIRIPDDAFERLFDFFDNWQWHLDDRPAASGRDINPDVLGYIFEKHINKRSEKGAYYTQEDITNHIAKNTILPFLLERARENCKIAFTEGFGVWRFLREDPDDYIYDAVKHGCHLPDEEIPENIRIGISATEPNLSRRRKDWNTFAPREFALPAETWRECIARRARHAELKRKLAAGEITTISALTANNLDIAAFVHDVLEEYEGSDFIAVFFRAIAGVREKWSVGTNEKFKRGISILDPACGSGAFLFAALSVLEPLYEKCVKRMKEFISEGMNTGPYALFRAVLKDMAEHPSRRYWIYKTIILGNLYGVDIMEEAAEIAKLRLFLKLAAEAEYDPGKGNLGLEPLPDIDYNIRAGNALVGFANMRHFDATAEKTLLDKKEKEAAREGAKLVRWASDHFRAEQDKHNEGYITAKRDLAGELTALNQKLNDYMAEEYGAIGKIGKKKKAAWAASHKPFHWLAEFYGIIEEGGGFDVIIGNPPYVEYSKVREEYRVKNYETEGCGNLYAMFIERARQIGKDHVGMIVQLPLVCTDRMAPAQKILRQYPAAWFLTFDDRPGKLFRDLQHIRAAIFIASGKTKNKKAGVVHATNYKRWHARARSAVFEDIALMEHSGMPNYDGAIPKIGDKIGKAIYEKIIAIPERISYRLRRPLAGIGAACYYYNAPQYWTRSTDFIPYFWNEKDGERQSMQVVKLATKDDQETLLLSMILNSSLFYWWFIVMSDCRHLNRREINNFPADLPSMAARFQPALAKINKELMANYRQHAERKEKTYVATGRVSHDEFDPSRGKAIMDRIDIILAEYYGLSDEELDYIINYDYKYRMGLPSGDQS